MHIRLTALAIIACASVSACHTEPFKAASVKQLDDRDAVPVLALIKSDSGVTHAVNVGSTIEIHLPVTAGTGYSWEAISSDAQQLRAMGPSPITPKTMPATTSAITPGVVGGAEDQTFIFKAFGPGKYQLDFTYRQPWAKGGSGDKISFVFLVKAAD